MSDKPNTRLRKKPLTIQQVGDIHGKTPPQDVELEKVVLGAIMLEKGAIDEVADILNPETFYMPQHVKIYEAILRLYAASQPIDILTVTSDLRKAGDLDYAGGPVYIASLTNRVGSSVNLEYHSRILLQKSIQRGIIQASDTAMRDAYEDTTDVFDLLDETETAFMRLNQKLTVGSEAKTMEQVIADNIKQIEYAINQKGTTGVPTGLIDLDRVTGGWQNTDLIILAARPGMGKTALILKLARSAAQFKKPTAIFSLEMNDLQIGNRALAVETGIENKKLSRGQFDVEEGFEKLHLAQAAFAGLPLYIDDTPGLKVSQLRAKAKKLKSKQGIQMIIIDYLQLMFADDKSGNREGEISAISRGLKRLAKELNIPIIAISSLSRKVEERGGEKKPMLSDLRESGAIESDADMVAFLWRPEYYGITEGKNGYYPEGYTEIIIEKHRNGSVGIAKCKFIEQTTDFTDLVAELPDYGAKQEQDKNNSLKANTGFEASQPPTDDLPF
jgi:replicative DNA helicase